MAPPRVSCVRTCGVVPRGPRSVRRAVTVGGHRCRRRRVGTTRR
jgi:hypothetical protein